MNVVGKFESAMQGLVEGTFGRIFRSRLHPVEVSKKLERAMDQNLTISLGRRIAPNVYDVYLSPKDSQQFGTYSRSLLQQLQDDLIAVARARGYMLTSRPQVLFHVDEHEITGQMRVEAHLAEPQMVAVAPGSEAGEGSVGIAGLEETRELGPAERQQLAEELGQARPPQEQIPQAWLTLRRPNGGGQVYRLDRPVIHIGRHVSNEVVVNDRRVSRYHAEIRFERGQFVLYDLGSLNGVGVNGVLTHNPAILRDNDQIAVGNHDFIFQRR
jgi:Protein of unknown function (DUF3662)/FHA domain